MTTNKEDKFDDDEIVFFSNKVNEYWLSHLRKFRTKMGFRIWSNEGFSYMIPRRCVIPTYKQRLLSFRLDYLLDQVEEMFSRNVLWTTYTHMYACVNNNDIDNTIKQNFASEIKTPILRVKIRRDLTVMQIEILSMYKWEKIAKIKYLETLSYKYYDSQKQTRQ
jgi:hypothetical protein